MTAEAALPLLLLATSLLPAVVVLALPEHRALARNVLTLFGAISKVALMAVALLGVAQGLTFELRYAVLPDLDLVLRVEEIPLLFLTLSAVLWLLTTVYAIGYLRGDAHQARFFGFFNLSVAATMGVGLAGNLFTFLVFFELLTLSTYPLVVHKGDTMALAGGRAYLAYAVAGGSTLFLAAVWLHVSVGPVELVSGGVLADHADDHALTLRGVFALLVAGMGVKAALMPLHGWLPRAMVAPAPVSALLHAVAVVKAGAYGIVRVVVDLYGLDTAEDLGLLGPLAALAAITLLLGSARAIGADGLKARLAYSTIGQVALVTLGVALGGVVALVGGLVHLVHQGIMKVTLFYFAGSVEQELGVSRVSELAGVGRRMPVAMGGATVAGLAMIGVPPLAGFVTKWHLALGGAQDGAWWAPVLLGASTLLTAAYVLPILHTGWFATPAQAWQASARRWEAAPTLLVPLVATAALTLGAGLLAGAPFSPLSWAELVAEAVLVGEQGAEVGGRP